jgi:hypothetical protein
MNIFKKFFPHYESKREMKERLERDISFLMHMSPAVLIRDERFIETVRTVAIFNRDVPVEIMKEHICRKLAFSLMTSVDYEVIAIGPDEVRCSGRLNVAIRRDRPGGHGK